MVNTEINYKDIIQVAESLMAQGFWIFPLVPGGKQPATPHGVKDSVCEEGSAAPLVMLGLTSRSNIGIDCEYSDLLVVDLDVKGDHDGVRNFMRLWRQHEARPPSTYTVETPSGGQHLWFNMPRTKLGNTAGKLAPGVDTRGAGGYVVAPGSRISGVGRYRADSLPADELILDAPRWLVDTLRPRQRDREDSGTPPRGRARDSLLRACEAIINAPDGTQNNEINRQAFIMKWYIEWNKIAADTVAEALFRAGLEGNHPEWRVESALRSGLGDYYPV